MARATEIWLGCLVFFFAALRGSEAWSRPSPLIPLAPGRPGTANAERSFQLRSQPDGGYLYEGTKFSAVVRSDGTVEFSEHRTRSSLHVLPPVPGNPYVQTRDLSRIQQRLGDQLARQSAFTLLRPAPRLPRVNLAGNGPSAALSPYRRLANPDSCFLPDGTNICTCEAAVRYGSEREHGCDDQPLNIVSHTAFDLTDEYVRVLGKDPLAAEKAQFLAATFELRVRLATVSREQDERRAATALSSQLEELWKDTRRTPREKRRILFELWLANDRVQGDGAAASPRATIESFIQEHLPADSPDAYSKVELDDFRSRRGAASFRPYRSRSAK